MTRRAMEAPCADREEQLSALLDGDLPGALSHELEVHLESCAGCRRGLEDLRRLRSALRSMGPLEPPPEMFESVTVAVSRRRNRLAMAAAAGLAAAGLAALLVTVTLGRPAPPALAPRVRAPVTLRERAESELSKAERHYRAAVAMLRKLADMDKPAWPAERRRAFEADMRMLDRSVEETRRLARRAPTDARLQEMLFASYRTQIDYLRDVLTPRRSDDAL